MRAATLLSVCALAGMLVLAPPAMAVSADLGVPSLADPAQDQLLPRVPPVQQPPVEVPDAVPELLDEVTEPVGGITDDVLEVVPGNPPAAGQVPPADVRAPAADAPPVLAPDGGQGEGPGPAPASGGSAPQRDVPVAGAAPVIVETTPEVLPTGEAALVAGTAYVPALLLVVLLGLLAFPAAGLPAPLAAARLDDDLQVFE